MTTDEIGHQFFQSLSRQPARLGRCSGASRPSPGVNITAPAGAKTMAEILGHSTDSAAAKAASAVAKAAPLAAPLAG